MQPERKATAIANANIAFIKYWGNRDHELRLPANPSLSMNLEGLYTETEVIWDSRLSADTLELNGAVASPNVLLRVSKHLGVLRHQLGLATHARVKTRNNFPMGVGIASSASAFAALTVAALAAAGSHRPEREITRLARLGSGSAARSVPSGFVVWHTGETHDDSYAESIAPPDHWQIIDVIAVVSKEHKTVGSSRGHQTADTSALQAARVTGAEERLARCRKALLNRNFESFAEVVEEDSNLMHAVMMTSRPPLFYWLPATLQLIQAVRRWRREGLQVCYTLDAGPNLHCLCLQHHAEQVSSRLSSMSSVITVRRAGAGGPAIAL